ARDQIARQSMRGEPPIAGWHLRLESRLSGGDSLGVNLLHLVPVFLRHRLNQKLFHPLAVRAAAPCRGAAYSNVLWHPQTRSTCRRAGLAVRPGSLTAKARRSYLSEKEFEVERASGDSFRGRTNAHNRLHAVGDGLLRRAFRVRRL